MFTVLEKDTTVRDQIMDEAVYISHCTYPGESVEFKYSLWVNCREDEAP